MLTATLRDDVIIKPMEKRHAKQMYEFTERGREHFIKWIPFVSRTKNQEDIEGVIHLFLEKYMNGTGYLYGLWKGDRIIGLVLVREIDESANWAEIGYMIDPAFEGMGLVGEACGLLIRFLFEDLGMQKIVISCDEENERSIALAIRLGFVYEGNLRRHFRVNGELRNLTHYGLLREEYQPRPLPKG